MVGLITAALIIAAASYAIVKINNKRAKSKQPEIEEYETEYDFNRIAESAHNKEKRPKKQVSQIKTKAK